MPLALRVDVDEHSLDSAGQAVASAFDNIGARVSGDFAAAFSRGISSAIPSELSGLSSTVSSAFSGMSTGAVAATAAVAGVGVAAVAVGKQLYDLGAQWDTISDNITLRTGKIGSDLKQLTDVVGDVGKATAASLGSIAEITAQLAQMSPALAANSDGIRVMASNLAFLDANGQAVNIRQLEMAFAAFGVNAADQVRTLDQLASVSRNTGIPLDELIGTVKSGAPTFRQFGLDMAQSTGILAQFSAAGVDSGTAATSLTRALRLLDDDARGAGPALADVVTQIKAMFDASDIGGAQNLAEKYFGKNFPAMLQAIESGSLDINKAFEELTLTLQKMQQQVDDGAQGWQKLGNTISTEVAPVAQKFFTFVNTELQYMLGHLHETSLALQDVAAVPITADSALGRMLMPAGGLPGSPGQPSPFGAGAGAGGGLLPYSWGTSPIAPPAAAGAAGGGPGQAQVPYGPGYGAAPRPGEPTAVYNAEQALIEAQHNVAQSTAQLARVQADEKHTADDLVKAHNDIQKAQGDEIQAQLRLQDALTAAAKKTDTAGSALDTFGAQLDADLGLSKGLPGLADNLVRFIGGLAAAPLLGPLAAMSAAQGGIGATGSGLIGMAAQQGAFGPQFTPAGQAAAAAAGGGRGVTLPSASGTLGSLTTPADFAAGGARVQALYAAADALEGTPYSQALREDCSGIMAQLVNAAVGLPPPGPGERFSTPTEGAALAARGFRPGIGPPGTFRIGWNPAPGNAGHTAGTLPGGENVEQGGSTSGFTVGPGAQGFNAPQFTQHAWLPMGTPGFAAGGAVPIVAHSGEHVFTNSDVNAMGGQAGVYAFRGALHMQGGGEVPPSPFLDQYKQSITGTTAPKPPSPTFTPTPPGPGGAPPAPGGIPHLTGAVPGPGGAGSSAGISPIGGAEPKGVPGGSQSGGGLVGAATGAAAMAADLFAPGSGAAVQIASQEIQRAIKFGAQVAGIGVQGLMETFLPFGASDLANNNWITRIGGAFAGVQPQIPNIAGKSASVDAMQQQQQPLTPANLPPISSGQGADPAPGPNINVTYNNNGATEDRAGADLTSHLRGMYTPTVGAR